MIILNIIVVVLLIAATAFFVIAEFAIVKVRSSRIDELIEGGHARALAAKRVISNLDEYLSAIQLGITITALGLGWLGEPTVERILHPLFMNMGIREPLAGIVSFIISFTGITFLHVVLGELAPKTIAIQKAEEVTLWTAKILIAFYKIMFPFIKVLNGSASFIVHWLGYHSVNEHEVAHSEEELRLILSESFQKGEINLTEFKFVNRIFEFDNRLAREIMVPRTEMATISIKENLEDALHFMLNERYTRYPVIEEDKDHIAGILNVKDVFKKEFLSSKASIKEMIRPVIMVPESIAVGELLIRMQKERKHMAVLVDEYGGTAGLVTVEDILEEIVGEIRDEFDTDEMPHIVKKGEGHYVMDGKALVEEIGELLDVTIEHEDVDTIGGLLLTQQMELKNGETIEMYGCLFTILDVEDHHIRTVEVKKAEI